MNVIEQYDVRTGDCIELTINRVNTFTSRDVVTTTNALTTYKGKFYFADDDNLHFQGGVSVPLNEIIRLDVIERAKPVREIGWYEVSLTGTSLKIARYWNGDYWSVSPGGLESKGNYTQIRFIGK